MPPAVDRLLTQLHEVTDLKHAADLLEWDERVCMPNGGAGVHGEMLATIRRLAHEKFTAADVGRLIDDARGETESAPADDDFRRLVAVTARDYEKATKVPPSFVAEHAAAVSAAQHCWTEARPKNDFAAFRPHLERMVALKRTYVSFFPPSAHPYDTLLDDFEPGMTTAEVTALFDVLRPGQVKLLQAIAARPQVDDSCIRNTLPESEIWSFAVDVVSTFGFDWNRGRQDKSAHPFATAIGADDVRITTRFVEQLPFSLLFGTLHETGHGLYEQGVGRDYHRTTLEGGASLGVHESQSRLWENLVGRSKPFWQHFYPKLQARFPGQLGSVTVDQFYRAINKVQPSLIRVEADEVTYNLHVMLRVELEIALVEGRLEAAALPEMWNRRMDEYLGVRPTRDATGVLQDIHWAAGLFGYFATYTLGNVISAQLWDRYGALRSERDHDISRGEFSALLTWLRSEIHQHGRKYRTQELVTRATGSPIDPAPYLRYLETKFSDVYGL